MDNKAAYDKYLDAIKYSNLQTLTNIAKNLSSVNLNFLDFNVNWESSVKEVVDEKINDLKNKFSIITSEQTNKSILKMLKKVKF